MGDGKVMGEMDDVDAIVVVAVVGCTEGGDEKTRAQGDGNG